MGQIRLVKHFKVTAFKAKHCLITINVEGARDGAESLAKVVYKVQVVVDVTLNYTSSEAFTCPTVVYNAHS
jgi:hypothetical protein